MNEAAVKIESLMQIHPKGFDLSLDRIRSLLELLDRPQDRMPPVIHVAGTNGKGSTIAFMRAILESAGLSVHVHTSPHLINWHERYRIGQKNGPGHLVSDAMLCDAIDTVANVNDDQSITVYEMLTGVMFILFSQNPADVCLVEVGLGGRLDATNIIDNPSVSVIAPISLDHEAYLGNTLAKIAFEKAGIIKPGAPVVIGHQDAEALAVIEQQAARNRSPVSIIDEHYSAVREHGRLIFQDDTMLLDLPLPRLHGDHQISNAATAIAAVKTHAERQSVLINSSAFEAGMSTAFWPGRMQQICRGDLIDKLPENSEIWLDGGHNPGAAKMAASFMADLEERNSKPLILVCGMLTTKDVSGYFRMFTSLVHRVITVPVLSSDAGYDPNSLADTSSAVGLRSSASPSLQDALTLVHDTANSDRGYRVLIGGSLYLVGDALALNGTHPK